MKNGWMMRGAVLAAGLVAVLWSGPSALAKQPLISTSHAPSSPRAARARLELAIGLN